MKKYSFKCTCGDVITVDAATHEEGVQKISDMMTEDMMKSHFAEKHPGQPVPSVEDDKAMVASGVYEEPAAPAM